MKNAIRLACISALFTTTALCPVHAQEPVPTKEHETSTSLDAVTVYATKSERSTFDVPTMVSVVDTGEAGNALASDIDDLLEFTPGVEVGGGPKQRAQTVSIRGLGDNEIITLIDDRRQGFESDHDGRFFLDPSLLKSAEIVKGPSSAIYGGGALGGIVAFETKDADDLLEADETFGATTSFGYRSATNEFSPLVTGYGRAGGWDFLASLSHRDSGDVQQGGDYELEAEDKVLSGLFKAGYRFNDFHKVEFEAQSLHSDAADESRYYGHETYEIQDDQFSLKYKFANPDNSWLMPKLHLYYNDTEVEREHMDGRKVLYPVKRVHEYKTLGFKADNQTELSVNNMHRHIFSYGFEIYKDEQLASDSRIKEGRIKGAGGGKVRGGNGVPNAKATNYGFYLQDEIGVSTSIGDFVVTPAVRFDRYEKDDKGRNSVDDNAVSPKISFSYKPTQRVVLFGSWAQAFRAPEFAELYAAGRHFPGNYFVSNLELRPETLTTIELGLGFDFDAVLLAQDRAQIKGSWFTSDAEDLISEDIGRHTSQFVNVADAKLTGFEVEAKYKMHPLTTKLGLSYVEAEDEETGKYLSNNVPLTLVADVGWAIDSIDSQVGWRGRFAAASDKYLQDLDGDGKKDDAINGYGVHDLYYRWRPDDNALERLTVDLGIENLFDKVYSLRYAGDLEEGRSYVAKVTYKW